MHEIKAFFYPKISRRYTPCESGWYFQATYQNVPTGQQSLNPALLVYGCVSVGVEYI